MPFDPPPVGRHVVRGACPHDCPDTCATLVTVEDGRAVEIRGNPDHPPTQGVLCTKVARYLERTYSPDRLLHPMRRIGAKGEGRFERIGWDEALELIATRLHDIAVRHGPEAILPYSYAGNMGLLQYMSMDRRFFHALGASRLDRTICSSAGKAGWQSVIGAGIGMDVERYAESALILIWGSNAIASNLHFWTRAQEAKRNGAKLIAIDPYRSATAEKCHEHIAPMPGTDAALAYGMMHVLIRDGLVDADYIERHTLGYEALAQRADEWTPARAAAACRIDPDIIERLARDYGTIRPAAIRLNYGMQRVHGGANAVRAVACLPALVGAWRDPAGGALLSSSGTYPVDAEYLERPDLVRGNPRTINMCALGDALLETEPPVRALFVYNSNPVAVAPDSSKVVRGFARDDLFTVVHDLFQTDTADYADLLLPATSPLEHLDVHNSYGHLYVQLNQPSIAPLGESLPNTELFRRLARRMGLDDPALAESDESMARNAFRRDHPNMQGVEFDVLLRDGFARLNVEARYAPFAQGGFPTASGKCEFFSSFLASKGEDGLPAVILPRESVHNAPELAKRYPLAFISPPARNFLNSSFANLPRFLAEERTPRLLIHPADAASRGVQHGERVRIHNDRGAFEAEADVTDRARQGVVVAPSLWWRKLAPGGENANAVTSQALTDLGRGATFYDCLVEVSATAPVA